MAGRGFAVNAGDLRAYCGHGAGSAFAGALGLEKRPFSGVREEVAEHRRLLAEVLAEREAPAIEPGMLARLIRLCHPDKHHGSEAATVATQWLLARREARA